MRLPVPTRPCRQACLAVAGVILSGCGGGAGGGTGGGGALTIRAGRTTLAVGDSVDMGVTVYEPRGTDYDTDRPTWSITSNRPVRKGDRVGTVSSTGRFVAKAPGRALVRAKVHATLSSVEADDWDENWEAYSAPRETTWSGSLWVTVVAAEDA